MRARSVATRIGARRRRTPTTSPGLVRHHLAARRHRHPPRPRRRAHDHAVRRRVGGPATQRAAVRAHHRRLACHRSRGVEREQGRAGAGAVRQDRRAARAVDADAVAAVRSAGRARRARGPAKQPTRTSTRCRTAYATRVPDATELAHHRALLGTGDAGGRVDRARRRPLRCTVVEPDRTGLLATAAGALALVGFDIDAAAAYSHPDGIALEMFTGHDRFGRLASPADRDGATATITAALDGELALDEQLRDRAPAVPPCDRRSASIATCACSSTPTRPARDRGRGARARRRRSARTGGGGVRRPRARRRVRRSSPPSATGSSTCSTCATRPAPASPSAARGRVAAGDAPQPAHRRGHARRARRRWRREREVSLTAVTEPFSPSAVDLLRWAETLSAVARTGLGFTQSLYEKERFEEVLKVAADIRHVAVEEAEADTLFDEWLRRSGEGVQGYVTPKVAVAAIVANEKRRAAAHPARRLGRVALPGRLRRRRVLAVRDRGERGLRGDRHRGRAGLAHRGARRPAPRLRALAAVLARCSTAA